MYRPSLKEVVRKRIARLAFLNRPKINPYDVPHVRLMLRTSRSKYVPHVGIKQMEKGVRV